MGISVEEQIRAAEEQREAAKKIDIAKMIDQLTEQVKELNDKMDMVLASISTLPEAVDIPDEIRSQVVKRPGRKAKS
jgi:seryl-tRNA synthetase